MSGKSKKAIDRRVIGGENMRDHSGRIVRGGDSSGLARGRPLWGLVRATGGYPVPVSNLSRDFIRQGYRYGYETDV